MKTQIMQRSEREQKADRERWMDPPGPAGGDGYPYWARLRLDGNDLKKLGIDELPTAGDHFRVGGEFHVQSAGQDDTSDNATRKVEGVLHRFGLEPMAGSDAPKEKSLREELESARHQANGTTAPTGRIGARVSNGGAAGGNGDGGG